MKHLLFTLLLCCLIPIQTFSQTAGIDQATLLMVQESPAVRSAEEALMRAEESIGNTFLLDQSRVSLSSSLKAGDMKPGDTFWDMITGSMQLSIPIVPQVSLAAGLDEKGGSFSVTYNPFSLPNITPKDGEIYRKAVISLKTAHAEAAFRAENTLMSFMIAERELAYSEAKFELSQIRHDMIRNLYEKGIIEYFELEQAAQEVSTRRNTWFSAQRTLLEHSMDIRSMLGPELPAVTLEPLTLEELLERTYLRRSEADKHQDLQTYSADVETIQIEIDSLESQLSQTWTWRPNLSLRSSVSFPSTSFTIQASMSFSFSDLQTSKKLDIESSIREKKSELAMEIFVLELEKDLRYKSMEIARQSLEASLFDQEQANIQVKETELLYNFGEKTELEVRQAHLSAANAENQSFRQASAYLRSINDYLMLFRL